MSYWPFLYSIALQLIAIFATERFAPAHQSGWAILILFLEPIIVFILCLRWIKPAMASPDTATNRPRRLLQGINLQLFAIVLNETISRLLSYIGWLATLMVSVPIFLFGVYYILTSTGPLSLRLLLGLWPLALPLYFMGLYEWEMRYMVPETYLIPNGYVGKIKITVDDPNGVPVEVEGRRAIVRTPPNGQLKTRLALHYPHDPELVKKWNARRRFFYESADGRRVELATPARSKPRHAPKDILVTAPTFELGKDGQVKSIEFEILDQAEE